MPALATTLDGPELRQALHDFRTPLTAIIGITELLDEGISGPLTPAQREVVLGIQEGAWQLASLVDRLGDLPGAQD